MQTYYVTQAFYAFAREAIRIAFTLYYLRIFTAPAARRVIDVTLATNVWLAIAFILVLLFSCTPVSYYWNKWDGLHVSSHVSCSSAFTLEPPGLAFAMVTGFCFELPNFDAWEKRYTGGCPFTEQIALLHFTKSLPPKSPPHDPGDHR